MNDSTLIPNNTTNNSGNYCKYDEPESDLVLEAKYVSLVLLVALGLAGNIFVIVLAMKYTVRKNLHHLIINMAVSDALFLLMKLVLSVNFLSGSKLQLRYPDGVLGDILCKAFHLLYQVSYRVSLVTLLIISIERFRVTRKTLQKSLPYTLRQQVLIVGVSWLIPVVMNVQELYYSTVSHGHCSYELANLSGYVFLIISFFSPIVMVMIFVFSILTIKRLSKTQDIHAHLSQEQRKARIRRTRAAVRMVLASSVLYTGCWFPSSVHYLFFTISFLGFRDLPFPVCMDWRSISLIIYSVLPLFNSFFSPCIYIIFISDFREAAKKALCRKTNRRENIGNSTELQQMGLNPPIEIEEGKRRNANEKNHDQQEI